LRVRFFEHPMLKLLVDILDPAASKNLSKLKTWAWNSLQRLSRRRVMKRTIVYIDGYNLYYGRLRGSNFKWLDIVELSRAILRQQDPLAKLIKVRFFTSPALGKFASHGDSSVSAQQQYHRALEHMYPDMFEIVLGSHRFDKNGYHAHAFLPGRVFNKAQTHHVWKIEEKQTDVNIALAGYRDAAKRVADQVIFVTNDSDIEPAMKAIKEDFPKVTIGSVMPIRPSAPGTSQRRVSKSLSTLASWTRHSISDAELVAAQLPGMLHTEKKPIRKPSHW
jgi:uncharacterized LabA/DUF88 family protein